MGSNVVITKNVCGLQKFDKLKRQVTVGFVQVRLEVVTIGSSNIAAFVRA